ncbi:unnamed protein product [Mycena citricolor]|uniref:Aminotransferase class V domain-containing protein n=1 Tax=Mycena citricolor TaxID=2018698 RepID=A0AAD2GZ64_9AGAR|nr:unnamed protein product [Mycena citricolor]
MGNVPAQPSHPLVTRKRSTAGFSRVILPCTSTNFVDVAENDSKETVSLMNEKPCCISAESSPRRPTHLPIVPDPSSSRLLPPPPFSLYAPGQDAPIDAAATAYTLFLDRFPEYRLTWIVDALRRSDYSRLETTGETYVDYMGGAIYPESLIRVHTDFLHRSVLGNTHSVSNSSSLSLRSADEARAAVLGFFRASPVDYTVVFTANATGALKLVGESYPFTGGSSYVLSADSHNSVHGIRQYATYRGAKTVYIPTTPTGGFDVSVAKNVLLRSRPRAKATAPSLFALTGQSNITNTKNPLSIIEYAASQGYHTVLDAAALAASSTISLADCPVDAMAVSFYKMFGFPTGVGALVVKRSFLAQLQRPWFAGGTVNVVQVPGNIVTRSMQLHEQFEDGTINFLTLPAVTDGLRFLSAYLPFLPLRLSCLLKYLVISLGKLRHETGLPVVRILSAIPSQRLKNVGEQSDTGSIISLIFLDPNGEMMSNSFVEFAAAKLNISLRTGCMCNSGGAAALLGFQPTMELMYEGITVQGLEQLAGMELGVVRISLGLASNFQDVWTVLRFAQLLAAERTRSILWEHYTDATGVVIGEAI